MFALFLSMSSAAWATSVDTLPAGSQVVYGGAALNTFSQRQHEGEDGIVLGEVDRAMRYRLDLYYARGLTDRLSMEVSVPLLYSTVIDAEDKGPCSKISIEGYCDPIASTGSVGLHARYRLWRAPFVLSGGLGVLADPWNAGVRDRYTAMGDGTVDVLPTLHVGRDLRLGRVDLDLVGRVAYAWRFGRTIDQGSAGPFRAPADDVRGAVAVRAAPPGPIAVELGADGLQRLWGVDWDDAYQAEYFPTTDRWSVLYYNHLAVSGKLSIELARDVGLHLSVNRVLRSRNGPTDTTDVSIGVHRYFAAPGPG